MAKYYVDCIECSTEFSVNLIGKGTTRQWKLENTEWICEECKEAQRVKDNKKAKIENEECGFQTLKGSEKQVAWAETLRKKKSDELDKIINKINVEPENTFISKIKIEEPAYKIEQLFLKDSASWWIDNRFTDIVDLLNSLPLKEKNISDENNLLLKKEVEIEATVRPLEPITETIANISMIDEKKISITFPEKIEDFRLLVREHGYSWSGSSWNREILSVHGDIADRVANIGNELLSNGFIICIFDDKLRQKSIDGVYEPEHTRWIQDYKGKFSIRWKRYFEDFYKKAKKIPTSVWSNPTVDIKSEQFEYVEDFANEYDFKFTPKAKELLLKAKEDKKAQLIPTVTKGKEPKKATEKEKDFEVKEGEIDETLLD